MIKNKISQQSEKGQSLVELTISLVFLTILLIGVVDFGLAFFSWVAIRDASQEGAIFGAVHPVDSNGNLNSDIETRIRSVSTTPVNLSDTSRVHVTITPGDPPCPGMPVEVLVEYDYQTITPLVSTFVGRSDFKLRAKTVNTILTSGYASCQ
mgnify:CR=1 FL=1